MEKLADTWNLNARKKMDREENARQNKKSGERDEESVSEDDQTTRFKLLERAAIIALKKSMDVLTLEKLSTCYPTLASNEEGLKALKNAELQVKEFWFKNSQNEFNNIFQEKSVKTKLDELDQIIRESLQNFNNKSENGKLVIEDLKPDDVLLNNLYQNKVHYYNELISKYMEIKEKNKETARQIVTISQISTQTVGELDSKFEELQRINQEMGYAGDEEMLALGPYDGLFARLCQSEL
ncbi:MIND complex subunit NNF1 ASCRUDRAFT_152726 [Ascoidea rubescens DSM 1968]|uniref:Uncharacterized protein n=1 Tax=Ascoidea rubescens DSM 1968 TaxID=1344418 RepID=A0A1D2VF16_9ASCO|nr:hypothetical protein ASCRUDRAFT_152726 [Ascoidea rubescens DSM 1968]ODV60251.1 hypothetical protein ASCRUDRAFT_152726 [Ascoidea rubescens DSM 1968]